LHGITPFFSLSLKSNFCLKFEILLNFQWQNCSILNNFCTVSGSITNSLMHLYSSKAFQQYQEHSEGCNGLGVLNVLFKRQNIQYNFLIVGLHLLLHHIICLGPIWTMRTCFGVAYQSNFQGLFIQKGISPWEYIPQHLTFKHPPF
jgi:hypothetical protein